MDGHKDVATLSNPTLDEDCIVYAGKDFDQKVCCQNMTNSSFMGFLIYDGKTSVLMPRTEHSVQFTDHEGNEATFSHRELVVYESFQVHVSLKLKRIGHSRNDSEGENNFSENPGFFTGIESVHIHIENTSFKQFSRYVLTWN